MPRTMTVMSGTRARIENRLVNVSFAGWESNTYKLQQNGWQLSVAEDPASMHLQIAMKHPALSMYGLTERIDYHRMEDLEDMQRHSGVSVQVIRMETNMKIQQPVMMYRDAQSSDMSGFVPVDARPAVTMKEQTHIDDFRIFRPLAQHNQIIVPEQNVDELLAKIHELQHPEQERIREDKRKRLQRELHRCNQDVNNYDISTNIVAEIATLT